MLRLGFDSRYKIDRLLAKYADPIDIPDELVNLKIALRKAQLALRQTRKNAANHRRELLAQRTTDALIKNNPTMRKAAERIQKAEILKELHSKLWFISKDGENQSGLSRLEVPRDPLQDPKKCSEWMAVDTPDEITQYLLERNKTHFSQAEGTPFTVSPMKVDVNFGATTETCEMMLSGDYNDSDVADLTGLVIKHFHTLTGKDPLPQSITEKSMMDKYKFGQKR